MDRTHGQEIMTLSRIATYVSFTVFMMASMVLAPGSAGHAGARAQAMHNSRVAR